MGLVQIVADFLAAAGVGGREPVVVACSGGPDSVAVAHVAAQLSARGQLGQVHLLYVDHGLRDDSAGDGQRVAALASAIGATYHLARVEVDTARASLEAAARDARYQALRRVTRELSIDWVLLGHTASDQAETVLMRILRGTGLVGLAGIPPRRGRYLRPLISVTRAQILEYLAERDIDAVDDSMNSDPTFLRNRVRRRWLPELEEENPKLAESLVRLADSAREQREVLDFAADQLLSRARLSEDGAVLSIEPLLAAPPAVAKRALAGAAQAAGGEPLHAVHQEAALALLSNRRGGTVSLDLPKLRMIKEYDCLRLVRPGPVAEDRGRADVRGATGPFVVRRWQPGDRMRPERLRGRSRKLSDLFIDRRVPREQRKRARVVTRQSDGEIVWAEHIGPAYGIDIEVHLTESRGVTSKN